MILRFKGLLLTWFICSSYFANAVDLRWIGERPAINSGAAFGVPFKQGEVLRDQRFVLLGEQKQEMLTQHWPMAFWPDGSVKWLGVAVSGDIQGHYQLGKTDRRRQQRGIRASLEGGKVIVTDSILQCIIDTRGENLIESISLNGVVTGKNGRLIAILEDRERAAEHILSQEHFVSDIHVTQIEQSGPARVVVKIDGVHRSLRNNRTLLPFTVRLYFYAGTEQMKVVHSFVYDGDQHKDFIKGIGIEMSVPFRESAHNRHIRFSGEAGGFWSEPVKPIVSRYPFVVQGIRDIPSQQMAGNRVPEITSDEGRTHTIFNHLPEWDSYKLTQLHSDAFTISKRTNAQSSWLFSAAGKRSSGFALAGDVSGGMAVAVKDFWQSFPASLEITDARSTEARLRAWFWSPDGDAMDLRHYDTIGHDLDATYEDYQEGLSTPFGIARTSEMTFFALSKIPDLKTLSAMEKTGRDIIQLSCSPEYFHAVKAFGTWSLPNRSNHIRNWIENQLDSSILFYQRAIEEHRWYGFWNYGDVMHTYDASRHMWRYDVGGYAWANTELAPGNWLWLSFLRSGRADIFRMAEAMTRHTGEVDAYHIGPMKGLGTRHNVSHWGCGAKEARVGQAAWKRQHYYLTTDERSGDLMKESLDAEASVVNLDPLRIAQPRTEFPFEGPARLRWGPDWLALAGNWFTEWERTGSRQFRNKIMAGMESLSQLPDNLFTGPGGLSYDPNTSRMKYDGKPGVVNKNHLATIMGGYELLDEMFQAIEHPAFRNTFTQFALHYGMDDNDSRRTPETRRWGNVGFRIPRLAAFAARELEADDVAERAWKDFLGERFFSTGKLRSMYNASLVEQPSVLNPVHENPRVGTNGASQWGINAIIMTELLGDWLDKYAEQQQQATFQQLKSKPAKTVLEDDFICGWQQNWWPDGQKATLKTGLKGLTFHAGPTPASDADHTVLWTKQSFDGDLRISFDFVRLDSATRYVNILYLMAEGSGKEPYHKDISLWNEQRSTPAMRHYFNHMQLYHLSFAAFENDNNDPKADYVRARRYAPETGRGLAGTELLPDYNQTGLFQPGVKHHFTVIKTGNDLWMEVSNADKTKLFHWKTEAFPLLNSGRIGLRLMGSRSSQFSNFKVESL
jgi:hypothetical protein